MIPGVNTGDVLKGKSGRYRLDRELGRGATAIVVEALDLEHGQPVALKLMLPGTARRTDAATRFLREAEAVKQLASEHVVRILDTGLLDDGTPFIAMELLDGQDLGQYLRERGRLTVEDVVDFIIQASDALVEAHRAGMVHRDLKPRNLFLTERAGLRYLKVVDFGSSKVSFATTDHAQTQSTDTVGTMAYMAPEQMSSPDVDARADVWSLGVVMYELLVGRRPFETASLPDLIMAVKDDPHPPLRAVPERLAAIVDACLEKDPARRIPDLATLVWLLKPFAPARSRRCLDALLHTTAPDRAALTRMAPKRTSRRWRAPWRVGGVVVAVSAVVGVVLARRSDRARAPAASITTPACVPESDAQLCTKLNASCDAVATTDSCGNARTPNCGACIAPESCGGDGRPNNCGYAGTFAITLGGAKDEIARAIAQTSDGGYVIVGTTQSQGAGGQDVLVVRLEPSGRVRWQRSYGGARDDEGYSVAPTPDGGAIVGGTTTSFGAGDADGWVLKLDEHGDIEWQRTYGGTDSDNLRAVRPTRPFGYVAAGGTRSFGAGDEDIWVLKLDATGAVQWERTFGEAGAGPDGTYADSTGSIEQLSNNGYFIAGDAYLPLSAGHWDGWALKLHPDGAPVWETTIGGAGREHLRAGHQLPDGSYLATGGTQSFGAGADDLWVVLLDGLGELRWQSSYGGRGNEEGLSARVTADGGFLVGGYTSSFGADQDGWLVKLDADGDVEWQRAYGGPGVDDIRALAPTFDGQFVALGSTASFGAGGVDIWVLKLDADGGVGDGCPSGIGMPTSAKRTRIDARIGSTNVVGTSKAQSTTPAVLPNIGAFAAAPLCADRR